LLVSEIPEIFWKKILLVVQFNIQSAVQLAFENFHIFISHLNGFGELLHFISPLLTVLGIPEILKMLLVIQFNIQPVVKLAFENFHIFISH